MLLSILLTIHIIVCIALVGVILLQRSEGGAFGVGGGGGGAGNFMTARGAGDLLTRTTAILAALFFILSLTLTLLSGRGHGGSSVADRMKIEKLDLKDQVPPPAAPSAPAPSVPGAPASGGLLQAPQPQVGPAAPAAAPNSAALPADPLAAKPARPANR